ncbi:hypothetical protein Afil01_21020 [Actinorhabdospora filicis]|uniref:Uncharacterized protein n=1 Tax=Actinorhabdospora filicis TaxID=1785913 RepID=A0A9W6SJW8_9ACTN|nr:hypothetical protein [Actinorhabdospora filicis]GLZ77295.1 hypothetical protein Afil01_21020 [Actinorhabdospora filicis]
MSDRSAYAILDDIAAILHPRPEPPGDVRIPAVAEYYTALLQDVSARREKLIADLRVAWDRGGVDPLLAALEESRARREAAENDIRKLLAYAREFVAPRPYTLKALAEASGLSFSGVRTAYGEEHVEAAAEATGSRPRG